MLSACQTTVVQVESSLRGDISFLARTLLFRAYDIHRLAVVCNGDGGVEDDSELGMGSAPVEAFLKECEMLWCVWSVWCGFPVGRETLKAVLTLGSRFGVFVTT